MKADILPKWYDQSEVVCACGNIFSVGSTKPSIHVEVCYKCHPFYTGEMKFIDTLGRVERFQQKQEKAKETLKVLADKKQKKKERKEEARQPKSLREMLLGKS